jgi:integrase
MKASTIRGIHSILSGAFAAAQRWEWTERNPAASAKPPTTIRKSIAATSPEDVAKVIAQARAHSAALGLYLWLVVITGVRRGELCDDAYLFSNDPSHARPWNPDWVTHQIAAAAEAAGADLDIKGGRHYTASQLLAGGFDLRNTAARLGHSGGGATTLRHYADPVPEVDRRAAVYLSQLTAAPGPSSPQP